MSNTAAETDRQTNKVRLSTQQIDKGNMMVLNFVEVSLEDKDIDADALMKIARKQFDELQENYVIED